MLQDPHQGLLFLRGKAGQRLWRFPHAFQHNGSQAGSRRGQIKDLQAAVLNRWLSTNEAPGLQPIEVSRWLVVLLQVGAFTFKVVVFCWLQILVRWTVPRFRYDQLLNLGWKGLIPVALVNLLLTAAVLLALGKTA